MSKGKLLAASIVWLMILAVGVITWKVVFAPAVEVSRAEQERLAAEKARQEREAMLKRGGSASRYHTQVNLALDGFSGYAVLRSPEFAEALRKQGIKLDLVDDGADYPARLKSLKEGKTDLAVFTIDALVKTCAEEGDLPATIVALIDETVGADAIVAYKEVYPNVDALNDPETRFVLTPDSPSETLTRVVISRFQLDQLSADPLIKVADAAAVVDKYKASKPGDKLAYALWQPFVAQMLKNERTHVVVDSSRFPSAIVDVLVASDDFIAKNRETVLEVVKAYLTVNHQYRSDADRIQLVMEDAASLDAALTREEAAQLVEGVWWKNTQENLAHFGAKPEAKLPHLEDMIAGVTRVMLESGAIAADPTDGHPNYLYDDSVLKELIDFHPGDEAEKIRGAMMPKLTDKQWESLIPAGTARAPKLVFARGTARLTERSRVLLDDLAGTLQSTRYYVIVRGNASRQGDLEANQKLASQRAQEVERYLIEQGVDRDRLRAIGVQPSGDTSVSFVLGELAY
ncbi:phosphate ABC transporter substrate-binding/OmpA family protein [Blastopirellula retiformator]|uniref:Flagellar motor protein MotD n=1 Tax=Blastopirellula retiformator TaxID=2527970 RepID=A0A5C5UVZ0_9BACT|nr:phosphate ABC transporter substrate-binding/OmpA family protein [Blastopirellula retiformator]TWT29730.1 flagellar motor protein MotD [Blastopirellula retiformator]